MRTRERILTEAMRLFGERGYAGTTIEQIEAAAGLSPGSGSLYRHFASKEALLRAAVEAHLAAAAAQTASISHEAHGDWSVRTRAVLQATVRRLEVARELVHLLLREHDRFPELLARLRDQLMTEHHHELTRWLRSQPEMEWLTEDEARRRAAVAVAAVSHYWFLRDSFRVTPFGVPEPAYLDAVAALLAAEAPSAAERNGPEASPHRPAQREKRSTS